MNTDIDHLDPANWMPHYDADSDRRAIPALVLYELDPDTQGYLWCQEDADAGMDPWRVLTGMDMVKKPSPRPVVAEWGRNSERYVAVDCCDTFIRERDFRANLPAILDGLKKVYDALWAQHGLGFMTRSDFDARADALRAYRARYTQTPKETPQCP